MEITSFVLGMLTIVAVIILTVIVVGLVKINQTVKRLNTLNTNLDRHISDIYRNVQEENQSIWRQFENTGRDITMVEKTIMQRINNEVDSIHRHEHELETVLHRDIDETRRYIDSRIDKVVSSGVLKEPKRQILNG